ncbi:hypothetical protein OOZ58_43700, partial [Streptomyces tauricus]|nr:hypothetical protein [Streptomyces tauricus]
SGQYRRTAPPEAITPSIQPDELDEQRSQTLTQADAGPDHAQASEPAAADRWTWLVIAAHTQLRLVRPPVEDLRKP